MEIRCKSYYDKNLFVFYFYFYHRIYLHVIYD